MAVIDSNNFVTHLVWSGLVDKATCGELKEAIELCTIKDVYTKADVVDMLTELSNKLIDKSWNIDMYNDTLDFECCYLNDIDEVIQQKINALKEVKGADSN